MVRLTLYDLSRLNLNAGYWDIFWPQFWQGIALSLLFVPPTTSTMDSIPREQMGNATSLYNFMRNIGGSFGIARVHHLTSAQPAALLQPPFRERHPYDPAAASTLRQMQGGFMARGADAVTALEQAYAAIGGIVQRQAAMLSFIHVFQVLAMIFVAVLPLLFLMRRPRRGQVAAGH